MPDFIQNHLFRIFRICGRMAIRYSTNPRPSSYPYITGDGFRNFAHHIFDATHTTFTASSVKERDIIFVGDSNIKIFFTTVHPHIQQKYILITHNGDEAIDEKVVCYIDEKIIKWYGINVMVQHPAVIPLPLGIENKHLYVLGIPLIFNLVIKKSIKKVYKIFYGFTVSTNKVARQAALDVLIKTKLAETNKRWLNFYSYLHLLSSYAYVASPTGSCVEGHRTWDSLYIKSIPIVISGVTYDYFKKIGMPIWVIEDWKEIQEKDEVSLQTMYEKIMSSSDSKTIWMPYWKNKIIRAEA